MSHRTLILLRHAKSEYPHGVPDHDRPLAARGRREAPLAGEWIRTHLPTIDQVLCSTATRTRQTLAGAAIDAPTTFLDELYGESHSVYLDVIRERGGDARTLLVVGHEPSISATALALARDRMSKPARRIETKYPTSAVAVFGIPSTWAELSTGHGDLTHFHVPR